MQRHCYWNSSSLQRHVSSWCKVEVKIKLCEKSIKSLRKLQLRMASSETDNPTPQVSSSAAGMVQGPLHMTGQLLYMDETYCGPKSLSSNAFFPSQNVASVETKTYLSQNFWKSCWQSRDKENPNETYEGLTWSLEYKLKEWYYKFAPAVSSFVLLLLLRHGGQRGGGGGGDWTREQWFCQQ